MEVLLILILGDAGVADAGGLTATSNEPEKSENEQGTRNPTSHRVLSPIWDVVRDHTDRGAKVVERGEMRQR